MDFAELTVLVGRDCRWLITVVCLEERNDVIQHRLGVMTDAAVGDGLNREMQPRNDALAAVPAIWHHFCTKELRNQQRSLSSHASLNGRVSLGSRDPM